MTLSQELTWRGFVNQTTLDDISELDAGDLSFYWGVDPSSDSMTVGNLASAMMVRHFIDAGHKAYLLVGGATGMIGDPDGKSDERNLKTLEEIAKNKSAISAQYTKIFSGSDFAVVDNYDWLKDVKYIDFLREVGKNVPLSQMLGRDFVQSRIGTDGSGISYAEFSYSLMQGYDFLHLFRENNVTLQVCGADQWGNSVAGVDLIRRLEGKEAHVFSTSLIVNKATGVKFGKSEDGAVWLDESKTSVYAFYQFWLNVDDQSVIDLLKIYTLLPKSKIDELKGTISSDPSSRKAQRALADEVTALVHGADRLKSVQKVTDVLFGEKPFESLSEGDKDILSKEIASITVGQSVINALVQTGLSASNGDAKRLIDSGAISINQSKIDADQILDSSCLIKKGKNSFILVR